jgi:hypothetical protein
MMDLLIYGAINRGTLTAEDNAVNIILVMLIPVFQFHPLTLEKQGNSRQAAFLWEYTRNETKGHTL